MAGTVREVEVFPICMREMDVLEVEDVTPGMRRVILGGPSMRSHHRDGVELPDVRTTGFDDDIKLLPVDPATGSLPFDIPRNLDNGTVDWPAGAFPYSRTYTVRKFDESTGEMAVDFAIHDGGLASDWAYRVQPGEKILVAGPKHSSSPRPSGAVKCLPRHLIAPLGRSPGRASGQRQGASGPRPRRHRGRPDGWRRTVVRAPDPLRLGR